MPNRCQATTKSGTPCRAFAQAESNFCFTHDPARAADRQRAIHLGAFNNHARRRRPFPNCNLSHPNGLLDFVEQLIQDTWRLGSSIGRARTLCQLTQLQNDILLHWRFPDEDEHDESPFPSLRKNAPVDDVTPSARKMIEKYYEALGKDPPR